MIANVAESARTRVRTEVPTIAAFVVVALLAVGYYAVLDRPVLDHVSYLDPWIYTASFTNYHFLLTTFGGAYYLSRVPWIVCGIAANALFAPVTAFFVLHTVFAIGGALFAFLLLKRYFGSGVALLASGALMLFPLFFDAHSTDYPDGAIITFLLAAAYFGLGAWQSRRRVLRMGGAGFFAAAAVGTNLYAISLLAGLFLAYLVFYSAEPRFLVQFARDLIAAAVGAAILVTLCGLVSVGYGGTFFFWNASVHAISSIHPSDYRNANYAWLGREPEMLLPLFLLAALVVQLSPSALRRWRSDTPLRFVVSCGVFLGAYSAFAAIYEFGYKSPVLETTYYFTLFLPGIVLVLGAVVFLALRDGERRQDRLTAQNAGLVAAGLLCCGAPTFAIYQLSAWHAGSAAEPWVIAAMAGALLLIGSRRALRSAALRRPASVVAVLLTLFGAGYAATSGAAVDQVFNDKGSTYSERRDALSAALQLIAFLDDHGLQTSAPGFWYSGKHIVLTSIQSAYLYEYTLVGLQMPRLDDATRSTLNQRHPEHLVLLCWKPSCSNARAALTRAGFPNRLLAAGVLKAGPLRIFVRALELPQFAHLDATAQYYFPLQSPFAPRVEGRVLEAWSFTHGAPARWNGAIAARPESQNDSLTTTPNPWDYELVSPTLTLPPGRYEAFVRGRVLSGGVDVGVLDKATSSWIAQSFYWQRQRGFSQWMATRFMLTARTDLNVVLANWVPTQRSSKWTLASVIVTRLR